MSSGDFAAELEQSVQDHLALIATAAQAAKARIGQGVANAQTPLPVAEAPAPPEPDGASRAALVNFDAPEPDFDPAFAGAYEPGPSEADAFAEEPAPNVAAFDDFAIGNVDDDGIPVWEDPA
jgi:hypothetical protein